VFSRIVVGTDGSETAGKAVREAVALAAKLGASLEIISAYNPVPERELRRERLEAPEELHWAIGPKEEVEAVLAEAAKEATAAGVEVHTHAVEGDAADAIISVAESSGADLIVVGNKGMTGARRFLLGSVPNKISHHAPCSVLIVRTT